MASWRTRFHDKWPHLSTLYASSNRLEEEPKYIEPVAHDNNVFEVPVEPYGAYKFYMAPREEFVVQSEPHLYNSSRSIYKDDDERTSAYTYSGSSLKQGTTCRVLLCVFLAISLIGVIVAAITLAVLLSKHTRNPLFSTTPLPEIVDAFESTVKIANRTFTEELKDPSSASFQNLEQEFCQAIESMFAQSDSPIRDVLEGCEVLEFRQGSVFANFRLKLKDSTSQLFKTDLSSLLQRVREYMKRNIPKMGIWNPLLLKQDSVQVFKAGSVKGPDPRLSFDTSILLQTSDTRINTTSSATVTKHSIDVSPIEETQAVSLMATQTTNDISQFPSDVSSSFVTTEVGSATLTRLADIISPSETVPVSTDHSMVESSVLSKDHSVEELLIQSSEQKGTEIIGTSLDGEIMDKTYLSTYLTSTQFSQISAVEFDSAIKSSESLMIPDILATNVLSALTDSLTTTEKQITGVWSSDLISEDSRTDFLATDEINTSTNQMTKVVSVSLDSFSKEVTFDSLDLQSLSMTTVFYHSTTYVTPILADHFTSEGKSVSQPEILSFPFEVKSRRIKNIVSDFSTADKTSTLQGYSATDITKSDYISKEATEVLSDHMTQDVMSISLPDSSVTDTVSLLSDLDKSTVTSEVTDYLTSDITSVIYDQITSAAVSVYDMDSSITEKMPLLPGYQSSDISSSISEHLTIDATQVIAEHLTSLPVIESSVKDTATVLQYTTETTITPTEIDHITSDATSMVHSQLSLSEIGDSIPTEVTSLTSENLSSDSMSTLQHSKTFTTSLIPTSVDHFKTYTTSTLTEKLMSSETHASLFDLASDDITMSDTLSQAVASHLFSSEATTKDTHLFTKYETPTLPVDKTPEVTYSLQTESNQTSSDYYIPSITSETATSYLSSSVISEAPEYLASEVSTQPMTDTTTDVARSSMTDQIASKVTSVSVKDHTTADFMFSNQLTTSVSSFVSDHITTRVESLSTDSLITKVTSVSVTDQLTTDHQTSGVTSSLVMDHITADETRVFSDHLTTDVATASVMSSSSAEVAQTYHLTSDSSSASVMEQGSTGVAYEPHESLSTQLMSTYGASILTDRSKDVITSSTNQLASEIIASSVVVSSDKVTTMNISETSITPSLSLYTSIPVSATSTADHVTTVSSQAFTTEDIEATVVISKDRAISSSTLEGRVRAISSSPLEGSVLVSITDDSYSTLSISASDRDLIPLSHSLISASAANGTTAFESDKSGDFATSGYVVDITSVQDQISPSSQYVSGKPEMASVFSFDDTLAGALSHMPSMYSSEELQSSYTSKSDWILTKTDTSYEATSPYLSAEGSLLQDNTVFSVVDTSTISHTLSIHSAAKAESTEYPTEYNVTSQTSATDIDQSQSLDSGKESAILHTAMYNSSGATLKVDMSSVSYTQSSVITLSSASDTSFFEDTLSTLSENETTPLLQTETTTHMEGDVTQISHSLLESTVSEINNTQSENISTADAYFNVSLLPSPLTFGETSKDNTTSPMSSESTSIATLPSTSSVSDQIMTMQSHTYTQSEGISTADANFDNAFLPSPLTFGETSKYYATSLIISESTRGAYVPSSYSTLEDFKTTQFHTVSQSDIVMSTDSAIILETQNLQGLDNKSVIDTSPLYFSKDMQEMISTTINANVKSGTSITYSNVSPNIVDSNIISDSSSNNISEISSSVSLEPSVQSDAYNEKSTEQVMIINQTELTTSESTTPVIRTEVTHFESNMTSTTFHTPLVTGMYFSTSTMPSNMSDTVHASATYLGVVESISNITTSSISTHQSSIYQYSDYYSTLGATSASEFVLSSFPGSIESDTESKSLSSRIFTSGSDISNIYSSSNSPTMSTSIEDLSSVISTRPLSENITSSIDWFPGSSYTLQNGTVMNIETSTNTDEYMSDVVQLKTAVDIRFVKFRQFIAQSTESISVSSMSPTVSSSITKSTDILSMTMPSTQTDTQTVFNSWSSLSPSVTYSSDSGDILTQTTDISVSTVSDTILPTTSYRNISSSDNISLTSSEPVQITVTTTDAYLTGMSSAEFIFNMETNVSYSNITSTSLESDNITTMSTDELTSIDESVTVSPIQSAMLSFSNATDVMANVTISYSKPESLFVNQTSVYTYETISSSSVSVENSSTVDGNELNRNLSDSENLAYEKATDQSIATLNTSFTNIINTNLTETFTVSNISLSDQLSSSYNQTIYDNVIGNSSTVDNSTNIYIQGDTVVSTTPSGLLSDMYVNVSNTNENDSIPSSFTITEGSSSVPVT